MKKEKEIFLKQTQQPLGLGFDFVAEVQRPRAAGFSVLGGFLLGFGSESVNAV